MALAFAAMMGWCGTRWPGWFLWWILHHKPNPPDPPEPWRDLLGSLIGAVGGIGAVTILAPVLNGATLAETGATAFFGGVFLGSVANDLMGMARR